MAEGSSISPITLFDSVDTSQSIFRTDWSTDYLKIPQQPTCVCSFGRDGVVEANTPIALWGVFCVLFCFHVFSDSSKPVATSWPNQKRRPTLIILGTHTETPTLILVIFFFLRSRPPSFAPLLTDQLWATPSAPICQRLKIRILLVENSR